MWARSASCGAHWVQPGLGIRAVAPARQTRRAVEDPRLRASVYARGARRGLWRPMRRVGFERAEGNERAALACTESASWPVSRTRRSTARRAGCGQNMIGGGRGDDLDVRCGWRCLRDGGQRRGGGGWRGRSWRPGGRLARWTCQKQKENRSGAAKFRSRAVLHAKRDAPSTLNLDRTLFSLLSSQELCRVLASGSTAACTPPPANRCLCTAAVTSAADAHCTPAI